MFRSVISLPIIFECQDIISLHKSWIRPVLEYGSILYSSAALSNASCLDSLQSHIEIMCSYTFPCLTDRRNACWVLHVVSWMVKGEATFKLSTHHLRLQHTDYLVDYTVLI